MGNQPRWGPQNRILSILTLSRFLHPSVGILSASSIVTTYENLQRASCVRATAGACVRCVAGSRAAGPSSPSGRCLR